jgi:multicomponent Na+:H+ antiporter subunit A
MTPDLAVVTAAVVLPFAATALSPLLSRVLGEQTG